jgi:protein-S-isoprenylcysteine O-methyltransferase Ste14
MKRAMSRMLILGFALLVLVIGGWFDVQMGLSMPWGAVIAGVVLFPVMAWIYKRIWRQA